MAENDSDNKAAAAGAAGKPADAQTATIRYIDRPDCTETFADSINGVYFDGQSLRIEFGITRLDDVKPNTPVTGRRHPAQRMVLTPDGRGRADQPHAAGRRGAGPGRGAEGRATEGSNGERARHDDQLTRFCRSFFHFSPLGRGRRATRAGRRVCGSYGSK